jgi:hypothetical protein
VKPSSEARDVAIVEFADSALFKYPVVFRNHLQKGSHSKKAVVSFSRCPVPLQVKCPVFEEGTQLRGPGES